MPPDWPALALFFGLPAVLLSGSPTALLVGLPSVLLIGLPSAFFIDLPRKGRRQAGEETECLHFLFFVPAALLLGQNVVRPRMCSWVGKSVRSKTHASVEVHHFFLRLLSRGALYLTRQLILEENESANRWTIPWLK